MVSTNIIRRALLLIAINIIEVTLVNAAPYGYPGSIPNGVKLGAESAGAMERPSSGTYQSSGDGNTGEPFGGAEGRTHGGGKGKPFYGIPTPQPQPTKGGATGGPFGGDVGGPFGGAMRGPFGDAIGGVHGGGTEKPNGAPQPSERRKPSYGAPKPSGEEGYGMTGMESQGAEAAVMQPQQPQYSHPPYGRNGGGAGHHPSYARPHYA